jgi:Zn-dependent protease
MDLSIPNLVPIIIIIFLSMAFHEAVHAFVSHWLGDTTARDMGRLTLNPLAHIDIYTTVLLPVVLILMHLPPIFAAKPVPFNPDRVKYDEYGAALIGISGPLSNLLLAIVASLVLRTVELPVGIFNFLGLFVLINIAFFVFNMIPFPPLDGSRLLYAFAPEPLQRIMYQIESMGFMAILLFFILLVPILGPLINTASNELLRLLLGPFV